MRILYPAGVKRDPVDRNSLNAANTFNIVRVAPHAATLRMTYVVPADRRFLLATFGGGIIRETAAAPVGEAYITITYDIGGGEVTFYQLLQTSNGVGSHVISPAIGGVSFPAAAALRVYTADNSTGGTVSYWANLLGYTFDL